MMMMNSYDIGQTLISARTEQGLSMQDVYRRSGTTWNTLKKYEQGEGDRLSVLLDLFLALGLELALNGSSMRTPAQVGKFLVRYLYNEGITISDLAEALSLPESSIVNARRGATSVSRLLTICEHVGIPVEIRRGGQ
jgi:transcriptional regulator with XRE-family HTH domain